MKPQGRKGHPLISQALAWKNRDVGSQRRRGGGQLSLKVREVARIKHLTSASNCNKYSMKCCLIFYTPKFGTFHDLTPTGHTSMDSVAPSHVARLRNIRIFVHKGLPTSSTPNFVE